MNINKAIQSAHDYHLEGYLEKAEDIYREILNVQPDHATVFNDLGNLLQEKGKLEEAINCYQKAIELNPIFSGPYYNLGETLQDIGQFDEAIGCYKKVIELNPDFAGAYYNLGVILQEKRQFDEAITNYQKVLKLNSNNADTYNNIGIILQEKGLRDEAAVYFRRAIKLNPDFAGAYYNLGVILQEKRQFDEAITNYQKVLKLNSNNADTYNNIGIILQEKGLRDEAAVYFRRAIKLNPDFAGAYYNLGVILQEIGQSDDSIPYYEKAIELNPTCALAYINLGTALQEKGQLDEAVNYYEKAIKFNSTSAMAYTNLGHVFEEKTEVDKSITYYQKAIQIDANLVYAHWNLSFAFLLSGKFEQGWEKYEWRWKLKDDVHRNFSQSLWDGSDIKGRTILLYTEQGLGDMIQFIRYAPLVAQRTGKVIVECQKELRSLFQGVEGIHQVITRGEQSPNFDVQCPLLTLPLIFNTALESIPANVPYICVDFKLVEAWRSKINLCNSKLKIGLVWAGRPTHKRDRYRSCPLSEFAPLSSLNNIIFYSLQKGEASKQARDAPDGMEFIDYTEELNDFSDTAAFIENLDLLISVDTSVAHLAGALGKPVWTLIPFTPDWRWMLNREDSPWYPSMRLFRQPALGDWNSVIKKVLAQIIHKFCLKK